MKKITFVLLCLLTVCFLLVACQKDSASSESERSRIRVADTGSDTEITTVCDTADTQTAIDEVTTEYLLLHGACPDGLSDRIKTLDSSLSYERWYLGRFGSSDQLLPDVFQSLGFDENTTEEEYLSAFRSALSDTLPEGNAVDRFSVTVRSEGFCDDGSGYGYGHFAPAGTMEGASRINYTFRFFVTVAGLESNASIIIKVENYVIKTVELCDLSRFLCYQDLVMDISPITAFANEAIRNEWKEHEEAGKRTPEYETAPDCSVRYVFEPRYRVAVSEDAIYLEIKTTVTRCIRFCGLGLGACVHYIKLS